MNTIELSAALGQAQVVENLKNFVGVDAQGAAALMTPERLAAVAGESIKKIGTSLYVDSFSGEAETAIDIIKDIVQKIPNINYTAINIVYIKTKGGVVLVDGYIYPNKLYGAFRITSSSENIKSIRLFDGEYKLLP